MAIQPQGARTHLYTAFVPSMCKRLTYYKVPVAAARTRACQLLVNNAQQVGTNQNRSVERCPQRAGYSLDANREDQFTVSCCGAFGRRQTTR